MASLIGRCGGSTPYDPQSDATTLTSDTITVPSTIQSAVTWATSSKPIVNISNDPTKIKVLASGVWAIDIDLRFLSASTPGGLYQSNLLVIQALVGTLRYTNSFVGDSAGSLIEDSNHAVALMSANAGDWFELNFGNLSSASVDVQVQFCQVTRIIELP